MMIVLASCAHDDLNACFICGLVYVWYVIEIDFHWSCSDILLYETKGIGCPWTCHNFQEAFFPNLLQAIKLELPTLWLNVDKWLNSQRSHLGVDEDHARAYLKFYIWRLQYNSPNQSFFGWKINKMQHKFLKMEYYVTNFLLKRFT